MDAQQIVDQLNAIETAGSYEPGQNSAEIWTYIQGLDEWDEPATAKLDPSSSSDRFALSDGSVIRWDDQRKAWYEQA